MCLEKHFLQIVPFLMNFNASLLLLFSKVEPYPIIKKKLQFYKHFLSVVTCVGKNNNGRKSHMPESNITGDM